METATPSLKASATLVGWSPRSSASMRAPVCVSRCFFLYAPVYPSRVKVIREARGPQPSRTQACGIFARPTLLAAGRDEGADRRARGAPLEDAPLAYAHLYYVAAGGVCEGEGREEE